MENLSTLLGKYGDEGDKLLFKVLNSGDAFKGIDIDNYRNEDGSIDSNKLAMSVCEKGLRYDLTVPFARYVVQHQNEIAFPFRRFRFSRSGVRTGRRRAAIASSINVMLTLSAASPSSMNLSLSRLWILFSPSSESMLP